MPASSGRGRRGACASSPAPRRPTWTATRSPRSWASRRSRCASCRPRSAAASAASSTSRCSRCSPSPPGARPARCAWSTRGPRAWRRPPSAIRRASTAEARRRDADGQAHRLRLPRRLQHRRLCVVGPDRRQPRAGACDGPYRVPHVRDLTRGALHQRPARRRLPRLRRAAGGASPRGADGQAGRRSSASTRWSSATATRSAPATRPRPARCSTRARRSRNASTRCGRTGATARGDGRRVQRQARSGRPAAARRRHRLHVVRHRQHLDVEPVARCAIGARRATARITALHGARRYRPGQQHDHDRRSPPTRSACRSPQFVW